jgi:hypothetical protein
LNELWREGFRNDLTRARCVFLYQVFQGKNRMLGIRKNVMTDASRTNLRKGAKSLVYKPDSGRKRTELYDGIKTKKGENNLKKYCFIPLS